MEPYSLIRQIHGNQNIVDKCEISSVVTAKEEELVVRLKGGFRWVGVREVYLDKMKTERRFELTGGGMCVCGMGVGMG